MEPITDETKDAALDGLISLADVATKFSEAMYSACGADEPDIEMLQQLISDDEVSALLVTAREVTDAWKHFREIRLPVHNEYVSFLTVNRILHEITGKPPVSLLEILEARAAVFQSGGAIDRSQQDGSTILDQEITMHIANS